MKQRDDSMSNEKKEHTPGPWKVRRDENVFDVITQNGNGITACSCADRIDVKEDEANARLIAAAPDMLSALKEAQEIIQRTTGNVSWVVEKAIAKATGNLDHNGWAK